MATFESNGVTVEFEDNSAEVLEALRNAADRALKAIGETAVEYAKANCPRSTGELQDHISYEVDGDDCCVGVTTMNPPYGIYVEFGTGQYAEEGGRQTPWVYQDKNGKWWTTTGQKPQKFIRPAAEEHGDEYRSMIEESLKNA